MSALSIPHVLAEATSSLSSELVKHVPSLTLLLEGSELHLAKVLTGRSESNYSNETHASELEVMVLTHLANGEPRNTVVAWLRILYIKIKTLNSRGHQLKTTRLPVIPSPEPSPFSPHRVEKIVIVEQWRSALFNGIKTGHYQLNTEDRIAVIALSGILCGCLLDQKKVMMLFSKMHEPIEIARSLAFIDFCLPYLGQPEAQLQRWFIDPLTEILLTATSFHDCPTKITNKLLTRCIGKFLIKNDCPKNTCPSSLSNLIDAASVYWESRTARIDIQFMRRRFLSHSLTQATWLRINKCVEPNGSQTTSSTTVAKTVRDNASPDSEKIEAGTSVDDSVAGIIWYQRIQQAIDSKQADQVKAVLTELIAEYTGQNNAADTYLGWLNYLFTRKSASRTKLADSTIYLKFTRVTSSLISMMGEENPADWSLNDLTTVYQFLLVSLNDKNAHVTLSKGLRDFHHYLSKRFGVKTISDAREVLGDEAVLSPVEANLITFDEYESAKNWLRNKALTMNSDRIDAALLVLILTFRLGLRRSEAFKLLLTDFHMGGKPVLLIRPHSERRLKSYNSKRSIPIRAFLDIEEIRFVREFLAKRIDEEGRNSFSPFVLAAPKLNRETISAETTTDLIHECLRAVTGDSRLHLHHLRHAFGTWTYLKLRAVDHPLLREQFAHLPRTKQYLDQGKRLRVLLMGNGSHPVRGYAFAVARLLGHSGPNVSMEHYLHCSDLVVWADTVRDFEQSVDRSIVVAASPLSKSGSYDQLGIGLHNLVQAIRSKNAHRYLIHPAIQPSLKKPRGRPKKQAKPQKCNWIELKKIWSVLHLAAQNKGTDEIADKAKMPTSLVQSIVSLAEATQEKIGLKPSAQSKLACPSWPRISSDILFFEDLEQRLIKLFISDSALFEKGIQIFLSHYNNREGDVIFRKKEQVEDAKQYVRFIRRIGFPVDQIRLVIRSLPTGPHNLSAWQKALNLDQAKVSYIAAPVANHPAYAKWLGVQLIDKQGKGHHKVFALAIYLASLLGALTSSAYIGQ